MAGACALAGIACFQILSGLAQHADLPPASGSRQQQQQQYQQHEYAAA